MGTCHCGQREVPEPEEFKPLPFEDGHDGDTEKSDEN